VPCLRGQLKRSGRRLSDPKRFPKN
jgi:hypothetical protein